jgi:hypothetical protein
MPGVLRSLIVAVLLGGLLVSQSSESGMSQGEATSIISPHVVASWFSSTDASGHARLQLLILWRGGIGWFERPGGIDASHTPVEGASNRVIGFGDVRITLNYLRDARTLTVNGARIHLGDNNVLFVDQVDSASGPRVLGSSRIEPMMPGSAGQIGLVLRKSAEVLAYLQCDARSPDVRLQRRLETLCLQNLGQ